MAADISYSRAEIYALILRALRGAGVPLGWCQDVAQAVEFVGNDECLKEIAASLNGPWMATPVGDVVRGSSLAPVIVACDGVLAKAGRLGFETAFPSAAQAIVAHRGAQVGVSLSLTHDKGVWWVQTANAPLPTAVQDRFQPDEAARERLHDFARLTYVPETEQSRQAGAGAGLTDND
ncbi:MAG: hypothetical protein AAGH17_03970 [Pseudomonadota bacterium]